MPALAVIAIRFRDELVLGKSYRNRSARVTRNRRGAVGRDHDEFFAAVPGDQIAASHRADQQPGGDSQNFVARRMAVRVVDRL